MGSPSSSNQRAPTLPLVRRLVSSCRWEMAKEQRRYSRLSAGDQRSYSSPLRRKQTKKRIVTTGRQSQSSTWAQPHADLCTSSWWCQRKGGCRRNGLAVGLVAITHVLLSANMSPTQEKPRPLYALCSVDIARLVLVSDIPAYSQP